MFHYKLRTLLIVLALGPPVLAMMYWNRKWFAILDVFWWVLILIALWADYRRTNRATSK